MILEIYWQWEALRVQLKFTICNNPLQQPKIVNLGGKIIDQIVFSPQEKGFFVLVNKGLQILYCDFKKLNEVATLKSRIIAIEISDDKLNLAGLNIQGFLHVWSLNTFSEKILSVITENAPTVLSINFHNTYYIGNDIGEIRVIADGSVRRVLWNSTSPITSIQFSHDNKLMAVLSQDNSISIWNMQALKEKPIIIRNQEVINGFAFSPDDNFIVVFNSNQSSSDFKTKTLQVWPLSLAQMVSMLCGSVKRNLTREEWDFYVADDIPIEAICR
jgi:WD40 repeat protein